MITVWVYVDTRKEVGDIDHVKVFATARAAEGWFEDNDLKWTPELGPWIAEVKV